MFTCFSSCTESSFRRHSVRQQHWEMNFWLIQWHTSSACSFMFCNINVKNGRGNFNWPVASLQLSVERVQEWEKLTAFLLTRPLGVRYSCLISPSAFPQSPQVLPFIQSTTWIYFPERYETLIGRNIKHIWYFLCEKSAMAKLHPLLPVCAVK